MRILAVALLLVGCGVTQPPTADCPPPARVPAAPPRIRTPAMIARFAVELELAREAERRRGDACAAAVEALTAWIRKRQQ